MDSFLLSFPRRPSANVNAVTMLCPRALLLLLLFGLATAHFHGGSIIWKPNSTSPLQVSKGEVIAMRGYSEIRDRSPCGLDHWKIGVEYSPALVQLNVDVILIYSHEILNTFKVLKLRWLSGTHEIWTSSKFMREAHIRVQETFKDQTRVTTLSSCLDGPQADSLKRTGKSTRNWSGHVRICQSRALRVNRAITAGFWDVGVAAQRRVPVPERPDSSGDIGRNFDNSFEKVHQITKRRGLGFASCAAPSFDAYFSHGSPTFSYFWLSISKSSHFHYNVGLR